MPEIFINYRTGDGDEAAALIANALSERFGADKLFRASDSISPGDPYPEKLLAGVRDCRILLAIIGPDWHTHPRLQDPNDWVRREIVTAFKYAKSVIPILKGRTTERLDRKRLPKELGRLADVQSIRLDMKDEKPSLRRICDEIANRIPTLRAVDSLKPGPQPDGVANNSAHYNHGTVVQSHNFIGDAGTIIKDNQGLFHTGKGNIYQDSQHFSGDGATYIQGDNHGGIRHDFGTRDADRDNR